MKEASLLGRSLDTSLGQSLGFSLIGKIPLRWISRCRDHACSVVAFWTKDSFWHLCICLPGSQYFYLLPSAMCAVDTCGSGGWVSERASERDTFQEIYRRRSRLLFSTSHSLSHFSWIGKVDVNRERLYWGIGISQQYMFFSQEKTRIGIFPGGEMQGDPSVLRLGFG